MRSFTSACVRTIRSACLCFAAASTEAAAPRAYVSVTGNDANICNVPTTPCRTYTGALSQVTPGGEIIVLDSGTFGGGTINQSVTINAPSGIVALAATPITVNPGHTNTVVLRGLTFLAPTPGVGTAITHQTGKLYLENVVVDGWDNGLDSSTGGQSVFVKGSVFRNHGSNGMTLNFGGDFAVDGSFFEGNTVGLDVFGGYGRVSNTVLSGNQYGVNLATTGVDVTFQRCEVSSNSNGLFVTTSAILRVSESTIIRNSQGLVNNGSTGTLVSFGNNVVNGNTTNTNGAITTVALQ